MKLKEIEQVEIFPPTTYFFISTIVERFPPPKKNSFALCVTDFELPFILQ